MISKELFSKILSKEFLKVSYSLALLKGRGCSLASIRTLLDMFLKYVLEKTSEPYSIALLSLSTSIDTLFPYAALLDNKAASTEILCRYEGKAKSLVFIGARQYE